MKRKKKDPVKFSEIENDILDHRICLFYVADRLRDILKYKKEAEVRGLLQEFEDECVHNIGINALIERYGY